MGEVSTPITLKSFTAYSQESSTPGRRLCRADGNLVVIGNAVQHILRPMRLNRRFKRLPDTLQSVFFFPLLRFLRYTNPRTGNGRPGSFGFPFCHKIGVLLIGADSAVGIEVHPSTHGTASVESARNAGPSNRPCSCRFHPQGLLFDKTAQPHSR